MHKAPKKEGTKIGPDRTKRPVQKKDGRVLTISRTGFANGLNRLMNKKTKQLLCMMLTLFTNPSIEGFGNLHEAI